MAIVSVSKRVNAPVEQVFKTWSDDYAHIYKFHPGLSNSYILANSPATAGKGALRQCDLSDGKNWLREKIIGHQENREIVIDIYETSMPLKDAKGTFRFTPTGSNQTEVTFQMDFVPGMGLLGKLMLPMMKSNFKKAMQALLDGNAQYVESGRQANPTYAAA